MPAGKPSPLAGVTFSLRRLVELERQAGPALAALAPTRPDAAAMLATLRDTIATGLAVVARANQGTTPTLAELEPFRPPVCERQMRQDVRAVLWPKVTP